MKVGLQATIADAQAIQHEKGHILLVKLLRERLAMLKDSLVDIEDADFRGVQGRARECKELLHHLTGEHRSKL